MSVALAGSALLFMTGIWLARSFLGGRNLQRVWEQRDRANEVLTAFAHAGQDEQALDSVVALSESYVRALFSLERVVHLHPDRPDSVESTLPTMHLSCTEAVKYYLLHTHGVLFIDHLNAPGSAQVQEPLLALFKEADVDVILPVVDGHLLVAAVGLKLGHQPSALEHELLEAFHLELSIACSNALMHRKVVHLHSLAEDADRARSVDLAMVPSEMSGEEGSFQWSGHFANAYEPGSVFWGIYSLDQGRILVTMGDAVGERLAGALVAAVVKSCCEQLLKELPIAPGPGAMLEILNASLYRNNSDARASCVVAIIDPVRNVITCANAGHPVPLVLYRAKGTLTIGELMAHGPVLGQVEQPIYAEQSLPLHGEASLILLSEGLLVPRNKEQLPFGRQRLVQILQKQTTADVEWLLGEIRSAVTLHSHDDYLRDDQALLLVGR